jgi:hypothetical protein
MNAVPLEVIQSRYVRIVNTITVSTTNLFRLIIRLGPLYSDNSAQIIHRLMLTA